MNNRLEISDNVRIEIFDEKGLVDTCEGKGFHNVESAIDFAYNDSQKTADPIEDYVFRVTDMNTDTSARYRINAGGHVRILPEE